MEEEKRYSKKVLFCASAASHIINFHNVYFKYLNGMGFEVHTVSGINNSDNSDINLIEAQKNFLLNFEKGGKFFKNVNTIFSLAKIIRREKYDIVSTHSMLAGLIGRIAVIFAFDKKIKVIHTCHGYLFNDDRSIKSGLMIFMEKILSLRTDLLFVMNGGDYKIAKKHKLCKKIEYINGMGIDISKLNLNNLNNSDKSDCPDILKYEIPQNKRYFLCVGEFSKRKNQKNIIYAFSRFIRGLHDNVNNFYNSYHLIFVGSGVLIDECKRLCETLDIADKVIFCGRYAGDMSAFYKIFAYCVVSASEFEGLPFNIMEALYYGIPVIASDVKGHKDLIFDGINGYLYEYNDCNQLSGLFGKISDEKLYAGLKSGVCLDKKYYFENVKEKILDCYGNK